MDVLVTRSLDAPPNREIERLQAVRFVRQVRIITDALGVLIGVCDFSVIDVVISKMFEGNVLCVNDWGIVSYS